MLSSILERLQRGQQAKEKQNVRSFGALPEKLSPLEGEYNNKV